MDAPKRELRIFLESRAGCRRPRACLGARDARRAPGGVRRAPPIAAGPRDRLRSLRDRKLLCSKVHSTHRDRCAAAPTQQAARLMSTPECRPRRAVRAAGSQQDQPAHDRSAATEPMGGAPERLAAREEFAGLFERPGDVGGEHGVVAGGTSDMGQPQAMTVEARKRKLQPRLLGFGSIQHEDQRWPGSRSRQAAAAAGADVEQIADRRHRLADEWRDPRRIVGGADAGRINLDRIDIRTDEAARRGLDCGQQTLLAATQHNTSPRTVAGLSPAVTPRARTGFLHQDTPPNAFARDRGSVAGLLAHGSSPSTTFPGATGSQWLKWSQARRLQLRGQPRGYTPKRAHRVPF